MYRYFYLIRREGLELRWEDVERDFVVLISTREGQNVTSRGTPNLHPVYFSLSNSLHRVGILLHRVGILLHRVGILLHRVGISYIRWQGTYVNSGTSAEEKTNRM